MYLPAKLLLKLICQYTNFAKFQVADYEHIYVAVGPLCTFRNRAKHKCLSVARCNTRQPSCHDIGNAECLAANVSQLWVDDVLDVRAVAGPATLLPGFDDACVDERTHCILSAAMARASNLYQFSQREAALRPKQNRTE